MQISLSIVSHNQADLVAKLLDSIQNFCVGSIQEVLLTLNLPESLPFNIEEYSFPVRLISNACPKGFGANHNAAFALATGDYFCILNPDALFVDDPFPELLVCLSAEQNAGVVAPLITNSEGQLEDSARPFPTPFSIVGKVFGLRSVYAAAITDRALFEPDWVAGMFMLFPRQVFQRLCGFDERYFLYYEDVDLCARLRLSGFKVLQCQSVKVVHDARRESHRNLQYFKWHMKSILRFFASASFLRLMILRLLLKLK